MAMDKILMESMLKIVFCSRSPDRRSKKDTIST